MSIPTLLWQILPSVNPPAWLLEQLRGMYPDIKGDYIAQLLCQRGLIDGEKLLGYVNPKFYQPASPFDFGVEMRGAVERLILAINQGEKVAIWGDFDADGVTSTAVLWDGLRQFFAEENLSYYIPNRLTESHGLNCAGINLLADEGVSLIITCDTGSTNLEEINYAQEKGIDLIITDHHTLPEIRPAVVAIINPRYLDKGHPLAHLSGVAVAYKLVEALYLTLPDIPQQPLDYLLDLVAIGLIADLVELSGDCRYLAQLGIQQLRKQDRTRNHNPTRLGTAFLLKLCQANGDRPTDISFGIGPRINAVSRIYGDASFCVELLTSKDAQRCRELAESAELANARRKGLQKEVLLSVQKRLESLDLSTTSVIVLEDSQWPAGVLGLVAGQVAQEYGKPTILLNTELAENSSSLEPLARGSARSVNGVDLYQLVKEQASLLHRFGGHPFAAGLSLPVANIPLFREGINLHLRQQGIVSGPVVVADLIITVAELGASLFWELTLLEPCGMGNPAPKLLIQNCWFKNVFNRNIQDKKGGKISYIKTEFEIWDNSTKKGFPGLWWGHYKEEIPEGRCDVIVELDFNRAYRERYDSTVNGRYEIRIIALRKAEETTNFAKNNQTNWIVDFRYKLNEKPKISDFVMVEDCPKNWQELQAACQQAQTREQKLALAYNLTENQQAQYIWQQLLGIAKYLSRTGTQVKISQISAKLNISEQLLLLGIKAIETLGFQVIRLEDRIQVYWQNPEANKDIKKSSLLEQFLAGIEEEAFRKQYFYQVPVSTIEAVTTTASKD